MNFVALIASLALAFNMTGGFLIDQTPPAKIKKVRYSWEKEPQKVRQMYYKFEGHSRRVTYNAYIPPAEKGERLPVLICVGGLPSDNDRYVQSDTRECFDDKFLQFADENKVIILGVGFLFEEKDWPRQVSYQYASAWSGHAVLKVLDQLAKEIPLDTTRLYMYGISAGAQFSIRFAQMNPTKVKAVAAHAAGGFDPPYMNQPTKFLLTVGEKDNEPTTRREFAEEFTRIAKDKGIDVTLNIIPGIGHWQTEGQNEMSREFFKKVLHDETAAVREKN